MAWRVNLQAFGAQRFGNARRFTLDDSFGGFRRHVAGGKAGAAAGENEIDALVTPAAQRLGNFIQLIGHNGAVAHLPRGFALHNLGQQWPTAVFIFAACAAVGDGEKTNLHRYCAFSMSASQLSFRPLSVTP
jgi:hypothetical protein